jgi:hypothetical protein
VPSGHPTIGLMPSGRHVGCRTAPCNSTGWHAMEVPPPEPNRSSLTTVETVRRLLVDAAGEALCDACLAFACAVSLAEMRRATEELLTGASFDSRDRCVSCRRTVPALAFAAKCAHCSRAVRPGEDALEINGDMFHAACLTRLSTDEIIRVSRKLGKKSLRTIEESQRRFREQPEPRDKPANSD